MYPVFLALRYARSRAVTYLALLSVAVSVACFVVVMSVLGGFRHKVEKIIRETGSPLEVFCGASHGIPRPDELAERLGRVPGVKGTNPYVQTMALIRTRRYRTLGVVLGVDLKRQMRYGHLQGYLVGELPLSHLDDLADGKEPPPPPRRPSVPPPTGFEVPAHLVPRRLDKETLESWEDPSRQEHRPGTVPLWVRGKLPKKTPGLDDDQDEGFVRRPPPGARKKTGPGPIPRGIIVGAKRARRLGLYHGDEMILAVQGIGETPRARSFIVVGFYKSDSSWLDDLIFIDRRAAEDLTGAKTATGISIWLHDARKMDAVRERAEKVRRHWEEEVYGSRAPPRGSRISLRTWRESRPETFAMLDMQDRVMMIILLVFFAMTGAFIMAILWVLVAEKTRDIGTVRALGAGRLGVVATFVGQGMAIGVAGVALGLGLGWLLAENVNPVVQLLDAGLVEMGAGRVFGSISRGLFEMEKLPVHYDPVHLVTMTAVTVAVSFLASLFPAWRAARLDPVEALRHE